MALTTRFEATIVLLNVLEKMPEYVEGRLKGMLGKKKWQETVESQVSGARAELIGKKSSSEFV